MVPARAMRSQSTRIFKVDPVLTATPSQQKKALNVDSPSFTPSAPAAPSLLSPNGAKKATPGISPKFAIAAPFKPQSIVSSIAILSAVNLMQD